MNARLLEARMRPSQLNRSAKTTASAVAFGASGSHSGAGWDASSTPCRHRSTVDPNKVHSKRGAVLGALEALRLATG